MRRAEKPTPRHSPPIRARCKQQGVVWTDGASTHRTADSSPHPPSPNTASAPLGSDGSGAAIRRRLAALVSARGIPVYLPRVAGHCLRATFVYNSKGRRSPCSRPPPDLPPLRHRPCHVSSMRCLDLRNVKSTLISLLFPYPSLS